MGENSLIKMMRKYKNILIKVLENYTFIKIFRFGGVKKSISLFRLL